MPLERTGGESLPCSPVSGTPSPGRDGWLNHLRERSFAQNFSAQPVPKETLSYILESSVHVSSPWNLQSWKFILVNEPQRRQELLQLCHDPGPAVTAPLLIVGLADPFAWKRAAKKLAELSQNGSLAPGEVARRLERIRQQWGTGDTARVLAIAQTYAALQHVRLVALACELCSWWVDDLDAPSIEKLLHVPDDHFVVGLLGLGYCEKKAQLPATSWRRTVFGEAFGLPWND